MAPLAGDAAMERYHLYAAVLADLHARLGDFAMARACLKRALALAPTPAERHLLARRLAPYA